MLSDMMTISSGKGEEMQEVEWMEGHDINDLCTGGFGSSFGSSDCIINVLFGKEARLLERSAFRMSMFSVTGYPLKWRASGVLAMPVTSPLIVKYVSSEGTLVRRSPHDPRWRSPDRVQLPELLVQYWPPHRSKCPRLRTLEPARVEWSFAGS